MLFNSLTFVVFFALVLVVHNLPLAWRTKKVNLLLASYIFYAAWNPPFVILLWISTAVDWYAARQIQATVDVRPGLRAFALPIETTGTSSFSMRRSPMSMVALRAATPRR